MLQAKSHNRGMLYVKCLVLALGLGMGAQAVQAQTAELPRQPQGLGYAGVYPLRQMDPSLDGAGVSFAVIARSLTYAADNLPNNDYQPFQEHRCFTTTAFTTLDNMLHTPGISPHATAVCSILFGRDTQAYHADLGDFYYEGVVPAAHAQIYEFNRFMEGHLFEFLSTGTLTSQTLDADVISLSCGHDQESWWTRGLEKLVDETGITVVASIGNGEDAEHPLLYPGAAANLIGVGVVDSVRSQDPAIKAAHFGLAYPEHSSCGPARDGRCKPDIVAPGNCLVADAVDGKAYDLPGNWSSFAAPVVAGIAGQLIQKAKQTPALDLAVTPQAGGRVIKAVLMNSATKLPHWHKGQLSLDDDPFVPLDYAQGAGLVNAVEAYNHLTAGRQEPGQVPTRGWDLNELDALDDAVQSYRFTLEPDSQAMLTCTLVWNRRYENPLELQSIEHMNLKLELYALAPEDGSLEEKVWLSDSAVDNVEHIYVKAQPGYRHYELVVRWSEHQAQDGLLPETYSVAWNATVPDANASILLHDLNSDGIVNELDIATLAAHREAQLEAATPYAIGDVNTDGVLDDNDAAIISSHHSRRSVWYMP